MRSTFLAGVFAGHLPGLGGQAASGSCLRVIELFLCGEALLFHNPLNLSPPEDIVNGGQAVSMRRLPVRPGETPAEGTRKIAAAARGRGFIHKRLAQKKPTLTVCPHLAIICHR
jgi:hypothetical protein